MEHPDFIFEMRFGNSFLIMACYETLLITTVKLSASDHVVWPRLMFYFHC